VRHGPVAAAPTVRRLARELGVRLDDVAAHIGGDRITSAAVEAFKRSGGGPPAAVVSARVLTPGLPPPQPLPDFSKWGEIEIEDMSKIRRKTAENMARAWIEIPTVTQHDEADITVLDGLRKRYAARVKEAGGHLTWTAILLNVLAGALKRFPPFNASVDMAARRIIYKKYVHIGVAVDTERGLLVPVIHDVDRKNVIELAKTLSEVSEAARSRNIRPETMQGATFTITNLGGIGGVAFSPIVNPPQVAILGVSRSSTRPMWRDEKVEPRQILPLALSYDHRIIDGADAARFLRWVCEALEEPFLLDLEGQ
jgi:pyruvate dehydrogenase E2 component (dihydrolipoamide acetyltransferase)